MKKIIKFVLFCILGLVALVLAAVLTLPLWLGPVVKPSVNAAVPKMIGTEFSLGHIALNPYTGKFELGGLRVGNPAGYAEPTALSLDNLVFDVDMGTLASEYVHVEEVFVEGVFVSYVTGGENKVDNFTQIQYNIAGGKQAYESKRDKDRKAQKGEVKEPAEKKPAPTAEKSSSPKVVVDHLVLRDIRVKFGMVVLPVPSVELRDIGKKSDGVTFAELCDQIGQSILKAAMAAGDGARALGALLGEGVNGSRDLLNSGLKASGARKAADAFGTGTQRATDAVGNGAKMATDAVGNGAKKATDAVGNGAKKAVDILKDLL